MEDLEKVDQMTKEHELTRQSFAQCDNMQGLRHTKVWAEPKCLQLLRNSFLIDGISEIP